MLNIKITIDEVHFFVTYGLLDIHVMWMCYRRHCYVVFVKLRTLPLFMYEMRFIIVTNALTWIHMFVLFVWKLQKQYLTLTTFKRLRVYYSVWVVCDVHIAGYCSMSVPCTLYCFKRVFWCFSLRRKLTCRPGFARTRSRNAPRTLYLDLEGSKGGPVLCVLFIYYYYVLKLTKEI